MTDAINKIKHAYQLLCDTSNKINRLSTESPNINTQLTELERLAMSDDMMRADDRIGALLCMYVELARGTLTALAHSAGDTHKRALLLIAHVKRLQAEHVAYWEKKEADE